MEKKAVPAPWLWTLLLKVSFNGNYRKKHLTWCVAGLILSNTSGSHNKDSDAFPRFVHHLLPCMSWSHCSLSLEQCTARDKKDTSVSVHSTWLAYMHHRGPLLPGGLWNKLNSHQPGPSGLYELDSSWKLLKQISDSDYKHYKKWKTQNKSVIFNCKSVYKRRLCVTKQPPISICRHETKIPHLLLSFPFICEGVKIF